MAITFVLIAFKKKTKRAWARTSKNKFLLYAVAEWQNDILRLLINRFLGYLVFLKFCQKEYIMQFEFYKGHAYWQTKTNGEINCPTCGKHIPHGGSHIVVECDGNNFCSLKCFKTWADMHEPSVGSRHKAEGCFITTAVCKTRNLPDDCHELTSLRKFRDNFMKKDPEINREVIEYYEIAPVICKNIDALPNSSDIYDSIWKEYLLDAVNAADAGDNQKAHSLYKAMVIKLKEQFLR